MKKTLSKSMAWLLSVVMIFGVFVSSGNILVQTSLTVSAAETLTYGDYNYTVNSDNTVTITKYTGNGGNVTIPGVIDGKSVTSIGGSRIEDFSSDRGVFAGCSSLTSVTIPDSVTWIGYFAFDNCNSLTSVTIPNSVTSVGEYAFYMCTNMISVAIGSNVTSIGSSAFSYCRSLTSVTIPDSVTNIGSGVFNFCDNLQSINVAANNPAYSSDNGILYDKNKNKLVACPGKKMSVIIPNSVTRIWEDAFCGCNSLTTVTIPDSVTRIGENAFCLCNSLTAVTIPDSVTSIGRMVFYACYNLTSVTIGNGVTSIGENEFSSCKSLTSVTIPDSVMSIGNYAFSSCTGLTSLTIPSSVTSIGYSAFSGCTNLTIYGEIGSYAETYANENNIPFKSISSSAITDIIFAKTATTLAAGDTETLSFAVKPDNLTELNLSWSSDNPSVAKATGISISSSGSVSTHVNNSDCTIDNPDKIPLSLGLKISAISVGTTYVRLTADNGVTASCKVTVTNPNIEVTGISLNKTSTTITKGNTETLTATITPSDATNKTVTWTTSNSSVATVSGGKITAVAAGTATITAKSNNGKTATCTVTVVNPTVEVTGIILNKTSTTITKGNTETLTATITPSDATNKTVTWTTSNSSVATVSNGKVTAVAAGTATITAKSNNGKTASCTVTVVNPTVAVTGITLNKSSTTITKGNIETLTATITPSNATNKTVTWATSNSSVATVSGGKVTAVAAGTATITAKSNNGKTATCTVIVNDKIVFEWGKDNWSFDNTEKYFTNGYSVNDSVMNKMQSDCGLSDYEVALIKQKIKTGNEKGFGGSCFGMTVSEIMTKQGDLKLSRYGCNDIVNNNSNTSNATSVINFIQELQNISTYNQLVREMPYMSGNHTQYDFIDKLETVLSNENQWVKLAYGIRILDKNTGKYYEAGYHAVLAYGVENCSYYSSVTRKTYDRRIVIADPNYLSYNYAYDDACLYYRSSDHSWIIPYWNQQNSSYAQLCYWNQDGNLSILTGIIRNIMKYDSLVDVTNLMADYRVNHYIAGVEINNTSNNQTSVQQVKETGNPNLDYSGNFGSGIARYDIEMDDSYNINENDEFYALWNPTANYEVSYTVPSDYYAKMDYEGLVYFIDVTNSTYTLFKPNGYVSLRGADANYDISILTESDQCVTDWFSVGVSGKETDNLTYRKTKDGYVLSAQNLKNVTVNAENKNVKVKKTFSTDYDSVLIYEIDENTIGLKVDKDGNGTYETDITNQSTFKNISTLSAQTIKLGETITATAKATGGTTPYTYAVYYKKSSSTSWMKAQDYSTNSKVKIKPAKAVKYDILVKVKDSKGTVAKKNFTVNVTKELVNNSILSATTVKKGSSVTATAKASGGTGKYTYGVYYKKATSETWTTAQSYGTNTTVTIKPAAAVKYDVCVKVKDSLGNIAKKYFTVTVTK